MAGYSGTPLTKKLGVREGFRVALKNVPDHFEKTLTPAPRDVALVRHARGRFDMVILFSRRHEELPAEFGRWTGRIRPAGMIWVAWPKKSSKVGTDLAFDSVQRAGLDAGLVDTKVCAIDETWSALRFVRRLKDR
jgi:hypothetical protein